jgi:hypothetical protein
MTASALLKPKPVDPDLYRLGKIVEAVQARLRAPGVSFRYEVAQRAWPEAMALAQSIEHDEGWLLFVQDRGAGDYLRLFLYLDSPKLFLRSSHLHVETKPDYTRWSDAMIHVVEDAKRARHKRLGRYVPPYTDKVLFDMRARQWFQWGRP